MQWAKQQPNKNIQRSDKEAIGKLRVLHCVSCDSRINHTHAAQGRKTKYAIKIDGQYIGRS